MSTPLGSSQLFKTASFYKHQIDQSLRFEDGDSPQLSRTPSSAGNQRTWTFSCWVKRGNLGSAQTIFCGGTGSTLSVEIRFGSNDKIEVLDTNNSYLFITSAVFRDPSAWYHIVIENDTTQATVNDRTKLYVNGEQITSFSTDNRSNFSQNEDTAINSTNVHYIGRWINGGGFFDGYMAEVHLIDGTALDADNFGETKSGIWIPKSYAGIYGTNGFYLDFADGSALGDDESGNANDYTASGLAATDVVPDSPTNNFPTILPDKGGTSQVYSEGRLHANISSNSYAAKSSMFVPMDSGKWYVEALSDATSGSGAGLGTYTPNSMNTLSSISYYFTGNIILATDMIHYYSSGSIYNAGSSVQSSLTTVGDKDIIGMLIDTDAKTVQFYVNGTASGTAETMANTTDPVAAQLHGHNSRPFMFNFGVDSSFAGRKTSGSANATDANGVGDFYYSPPSGAKAICAKNLPAPTIDPLLDQTPEDHFKAVLYTGTGATQSITGVGFQPDWLWVKRRGGIQEGSMTNSVRGVGKQLRPAVTNIESSQTDAVTSFDADGFSLGADATNRSYNNYTDSHVAWNWLAGGTASTNDDGDIQSNVSVNSTAKFSIGTFTKGSGTQTVGHGLGVTPTMFFVKRHNGSGSWFVYHHKNTSAPETDYIRLNNTGDTTDDATIWGDTAPTSSVFSVGSGFNSGEEIVFWAFADVEGYSKMGVYEGNSSNDGPFVFCGFRPAFLMVKTIDKSGGWHMYDNLRAFAGNEIDVRLEIDTAEENTSGPPHMDLLSNGFKLRSNFDNINPSSTMVFMAFAEQPFKYSNAR